MNESGPHSRFVERFVHRTGSHCGSTCLRNLMNFHGFDCDEALCFGLGSGLQFAYINNDSLNPPRQIHGRGPNLESDFCDNLGLDYDLFRDADSDRAWEAVKRAIDSGLPPMLRTDLFHLDYYQTRTHFSGHVIVLAGYDDERRIAFCSDNEFPALQETSYESLKAARVSQHPPQFLENDWFAIRSGPRVPLEEGIRRAAQKTAEYMLEPGNWIMGLDNLAALSQDIAEWASLPDLAWTARFAYQCIERRGTGGGAFRLLYAGFLEQAEAMVKELSGLGLSARMRHAAGLWTRAAEVFKRMSERVDVPSPRLRAGGGEGALIEAGAIFRDIEAEERRVFETVAERLSGRKGS